MGSQRNTDDPAADAAAVEANGDPISKAAATGQPSSSSVHEQHFVNTGMVVAAAPCKHVNISLFVCTWHLILAACRPADVVGTQAALGAETPRFQAHSKEAGTLVSLHRCCKS
jgi:hypothetical protein